MGKNQKKIFFSIFGIRMTQFAKKKQKIFFDFFARKILSPPLGWPPIGKKSKKNFFLLFFTNWVILMPKIEKKNFFFQGPQKFFFRIFWPNGAPQKFFFRFFAFFFANWAIWAIEQFDISPNLEIFTETWFPTTTTPRTDRMMTIPLWAVPRRGVKK